VLRARLVLVGAPRAPGFHQRPVGGVARGTDPFVVSPVEP
jgi:hypothetical protein